MVHAFIVKNALFFTEDAKLEKNAPPVSSSLEILTGTSTRICVLRKGDQARSLDSHGHTEKGAR